MTSTCFCENILYCRIHSLTNARKFEFPRQKICRIAMLKLIRGSAIKCDLFYSRSHETIFESFLNLVKLKLLKFSTKIKFSKFSNIFMAWFPDRLITDSKRGFNDLPLLWSWF